MSSLFNDIPAPALNLLPQDGIVNYYGKILNAKEAVFYFQTLLDTIDWQNDKAIIFGKEIITKRKVAWYGDKNFSYTYSKIEKFALPWTKELLELKTLVEKISGENFNLSLIHI